MKIVITDGYIENPGDLSWDGLNAFGEVVVYDRLPKDEAAVIAAVVDADVVVTNKVVLTESVLAACPNLKLICVTATGYNVVDTAAARARGILVTNVPTYGTEAVGQAAIAMLLEITNRVGHHDRAVREGRWSNAIDWTFWDYPLIELCGKTMGIIGYGNIGQVTGRIAKALGMQVIVYSRTVRQETGADYVSLEELLTRSDVIALHVPLFPETRNIIDAAAIAKMKDGVILLNNSRGGLIDEQALADALHSGKVAAAALDVMSVEPIPADHPLLSAPNCIITPHISWASRECRERIMETTVENVRAFVAGAPVHVVN